jgi:hypothetical protein
MNNSVVFYITPKKKISCAGKMEDSKYLAMLAQ